MIDRNSFSKKNSAMAAIASVLTALLLAMACLTGPDNYTPPSAPWEPVDSAWKVIENLEYAYETKDIDLYMSCFREDFEFHLMELYIPPAYSPMQDSSWGYAAEEQIHQNMFTNVPLIELTLSGNSEYPWIGDSTGQSYQLNRTFDLWVYTYLLPAHGYRASGEVYFICRPDTTDDQWYVWQWWDLSDTKEWTTWGDIKVMFY